MTNRSDLSSGRFERANQSPEGFFDQRAITGDNRFLK